MNVFITGGAGFIGRNLIRKLIAEGHTCLILDCFSPQIHEVGVRYPELSLPGVEVITGDVRDREVVLACLHRCDAIVHLAAETGTGQSMQQIERYYDVNVRGTALLLDCLTGMGKNRPQRLVLASSRAIYGEGAYRNGNQKLVHPPARKVSDMDRGIFDPVCAKDGTPLTAVATAEEAPPRPTSVYGASKFAQEQLSLLQMDALGLSCTALRFQNVYGPGQSLKNPYTGILAIFTNLARKHETMQIFEDGLESRDFVFINDVVSALYASLVDPRCGCFTYNIGAGVPVTVLEIAQRLVARLGSKSQIVVSGAYRVGDIRHNIADITKARRELNYQPKTSFAVGLEQFVSWALESPAMDTGYRRSLSELEAVGLFRQCSPKSAS